MIEFLPVELIGSLMGIHVYDLNPPGSAVRLSSVDRSAVRKAWGPLHQMTQNNQQSLEYSTTKQGGWMLFHPVICNIHKFMYEYIYIYIKGVGLYLIYCICSYIFNMPCSMHSALKEIRFASILYNILYIENLFYIYYMHYSSHSYQVMEKMLP